MAEGGSDGELRMHFWNRLQLLTITLAFASVQASVDVDSHSPASCRGVSWVREAKSLQLRGGGRARGSVQIESQMAWRSSNRQRKRHLRDVAWGDDAGADGFSKVPRGAARDGNCSTFDNDLRALCPDRWRHREPVCLGSFQTAPGDHSDSAAVELHGAQQSTICEELPLYNDEDEQSACSSVGCEDGDLRALRSPVLGHSEFAAGNCTQHRPGRRTMQVSLPDGSHYTVHVPESLGPSPCLEQYDHDTAGPGSQAQKLPSAHSHGRFLGSLRSLQRFQGGQGAEELRGERQAGACGPSRLKRFHSQTALDALVLADSDHVCKRGCYSDAVESSDSTCTRAERESNSCEGRHGDSTRDENDKWKPDQLDPEDAKRGGRTGGGGVAAVAYGEPSRPQSVARPSIVEALATASVSGASGWASCPDPDGDITAEDRGQSALFARSEGKRAGEDTRVPLRWRPRGCLPRNHDFLGRDWLS